MSKSTLDNTIERGFDDLFGNEKELKRKCPCNDSNVPESKKKLEEPIDAMTNGNNQEGCILRLKVEKSFVLETSLIENESVMEVLETPQKGNTHSNTLKRSDTLFPHKVIDVSMSGECSSLAITPKSSVPRSDEQFSTVMESPLICSPITHDPLSQEKERLSNNEKELTGILKGVEEEDEDKTFEEIRKVAFEKENSKSGLTAAVPRHTLNENSQLKESDSVGRFFIWKNNEARIGFKPLSKEPKIPDVVHSTNLTSHPIYTNWWGDDFPQKEKVLKMMKEKFGLKTFRLSQYPVINSILAGHNVLVLMPTGGGKSLCYQLPSLLKKGYTIVVSPLISLMQDQVNKLNKIGIPAITCNSNNPENFKKFKNDIKYNKRKIKLVYVSPEFIEYSYCFTKILKSIYEKGLFSLLVIDEAHCISQWGHDFRQSYEKLYDLRIEFPSVQTIMFTATATEKVKNDILLTLGIEESIVFDQTFNRPNLFLEVREKTSNVYPDIFNFIQTQNHSSGIIFCFSIEDCERINNFLLFKNINSAVYHAQLNTEERKEVQKSWMDGEIEVVCTTSAFGMGIDKPDVRYVIHHTMPSSIEQYYQEAGRAGRDGKRSKCIVYYHKNVIHRFEDIGLLKKPDENEEETDLTESQKNIENNIHAMIGYCETQGCRRQFILNHFNEIFKEEDCGACDNCQIK